MSLNEQQDNDDQSYIRLVSNDGFVMHIHKSVAKGSGAVRNLLASSGQFMESKTNEFAFRDIRGPILEKVCQYLYYKHKYDQTWTDVPEFPIEPEIALELLMTADFLDA
ncbi:BTB/POZ protein [Dimargaris cristalligena]|uniref:Elongin-C n=1 Tax=Dimargaris cristalligena TaxID=215637 RepID=A0A4Q0A2A1_9FUNG|nr:BTB/POZ protein [Dimargaris cristalligena]|eukprot:RKP39300.1 BTB/POZ protein [Dimargaris cristalligena]